MSMHVTSICVMLVTVRRSAGEGLAESLRRLSDAKRSRNGRLVNRFC